MIEAPVVVATPKAAVVKAAAPVAVAAPVVTAPVVVVAAVAPVADVVAPVTALIEVPVTDTTVVEAEEAFTQKGYISHITFHISVQTTSPAIVYLIANCIIHAKNLDPAFISMYANTYFSP